MGGKGRWGRVSEGYSSGFGSVFETVGSFLRPPKREPGESDEAFDRRMKDRKAAAEAGKAEADFYGSVGKAVGAAVAVAASVLTIMNSSKAEERAQQKHEERKR